MKTGTYYYNLHKKNQAPTEENHLSDPEVEELRKFMETVASFSSLNQEKITARWYREQVESLHSIQVARKN